MSRFRRYYVPNAIVFITAVTRNRIPYLGSGYDLNLFWDTVRSVKDIHPFHLLAYVVLPDHFHWLMQVAGGDFSPVLHSIKRNFTLDFKKAHGIVEPLHLWQARFWDHVIRDEDDLNNHMDYIHWNPVKHGHVQKPEEWAQSSYRYWLKRGYYELGWGWGDQPDNLTGIDSE